MTSKRDVEVALADYDNLVSIEQHGDQIIVRLKQFLRDKSKWEAINSILRTDYNGEYVPKSRGGPEWRVPAEGEQRQEETQRTEEKGNKGTFGVMYCPHCGGGIDMSFKPRNKEAS